MTSDTKQVFEGRIALRPVVDHDEPFLRDLYFATRDDLRILPLTEDQLQQLLLMQYEAQTRNYAQQFSGASHDIIELDDVPVGRLIVDRRPGQIECVDISLLPQWRNGGIGSAVIKSLLEECVEQTKSCILFVLKTNRARSFYDRMGFQVEEDTGTHFVMKWAIRNERR